MQLNNRVYAVGGLTTPPPSSLQWSSVSDQQTIDQRERQSHHGDGDVFNHEGGQQQVHEHVDADGEAAKSHLQISTTSTALQGATEHNAYVILYVRYAAVRVRYFAVR